MFLDLLRNRRSIRQFKSTPVEAEKIDLLLEAVLRAPSSRGRNPWHFVVVDEPQLLEQLSRAKAHGAEFLAGVPLAVAVCADPARCDVWIEDCAIAAILLQLAAEDLGLASCWAQMRLRRDSEERCAEDNVRAALNLPADWTVLCVVGLGYPQRRLAGHRREHLDDAKIHRNRL